ncbi:hypothetical protein MPH_13715, partial [Macrophomina phaseolina MS6]
YNYGICVVYRAETSINQDKPLRVPGNNTTRSALSEQLNQLRNRYSSYFLRRYENLCTEKTLQAEIVTSIPRMRRYPLNKDRSSQTIKVHRSSLRIRPVSPDVVRSPPVSEELKACLSRCAESKSFGVEPIIKASKNPRGIRCRHYTESSSVHVQSGNANTLLHLRKILTNENKALFRQLWTPEPGTLVEVSELVRLCDE